MSSISYQYNSSQMIHSMAFNTGPLRRVIQVESNNVEDKTCPICLEEYQPSNMITTVCKHSYCMGCYLNILKRDLSLFVNLQSFSNNNTIFATNFGKNIHLLSDAGV